MRCKGAFTLVELLVVIAIVAVLIAILLPTINMVQQMLIKVECTRNLHSAHQIVMAYASAYHGLLPCFGMESIYESQYNFPGGTPRNRHLMAEKLMDLGATPKDFACPAHPRYDEIDDSPYYGWEVPHWSVGGAGGWIKSFPILGYAYFAHSEDFGRHPRGGNIIPNHWATWSRFLDGRFLPERNDDQGNPPLACDVMKIKSVYEGFWHDPLRESLSGDEDDVRCAYPGGGGNTLFLAGDVVWFDWGELEAQGAYYEANNDIYYYFGKEKPSE